jgi:LuxR family maltose regulon positive regulatory protein
METKLVAPLVRPGTIARGELVDRLTAANGSSVAGIFAPAGYGKTTLLAQSIARERRPVAWVAVDDGDNDPAVLLLHVAVAIHRVLALKPALFAMLSSPGPFEHTVIHRVCSELSTVAEHVLVLDDVRLVSGSFSRDAIAALALHAAQGSLVILSGRGSEGLPIARLRATGRLLEIGAGDLALDETETRGVLKHAGVSVSAGDAALLARHTEGWAIGVYLAALSLGASATLDETLAAFTGEDRYVVDYVRSEFLEALAPADVRFLTATSILDRLSGPLCDAVLQTTGSARKLEELERSNLNVVPLDRTREWYRYHHLLRDALRSELARRGPAAIPALHRRAAAWLEGNGQPVAAVGHALAAGDLDDAARLIAPLVLVLERSGRGATLARCAWPGGGRAASRVGPGRGLFCRARGGRHRCAALACHRCEAIRRGVSCPRGRFGCIRGRAAARHDLPARCGADARRCRVRRRERTAVGALASDRDRPARLRARPGRGGSPRCPGASRRRSTSQSRRIWAPALAQLALYALERGELSDAEALAREAREQSVPATATANGAFALAASARVAQRRGDSRRMDEYVAGVQLRRPQLSAARPWISSLTLLQLARVHVASGDSGGARTILRDLDDLLSERPDLGIVGDQAKRLAEHARTLPNTSAGATTLTPAELRLLPLLPTHLSLPEIGTRLFLSRHTIKTQAISIYHKLDVSSRGDAVARAREIGLLDEFVRDAPTP